MIDLTGKTLQDLIDMLDPKANDPSDDPRTDTPRVAGSPECDKKSEAHNRPYPLLFISHFGKGRGAGC